MRDKAQLFGLFLFAFLNLNHINAESAPDASQPILKGRVVGVYDGDSLTLLVAGNTQFKIRLESIDAPEIGQDFGKKSKQALAALVHGKEVTVNVTGKDKYKRILGWVVADEKSVNLEMVKSGFAWNYTKYSKSEKLKAAEIEARNSKLGLWAEWKPMSPWDWRALQKRNAAEKKLTTTIPPPALKTHWLNTSSYTRHNRSCRWYHNTKRGRTCTSVEGSACGMCGG